MAHQLLKYCFYWRGKCTEAVLNQWASEEIIVITTCGPVIGYRRRTSDNKYIFTVFKGIAYAKPPVGELRFRDPVPPDPWTEPPRQYIRGGCMAPQLYAANKIVIGNEDCLRLRIYTRSLKPKRLKPVMVWIHGGSFVHGSVSADIYNPEYLLREKIVLVAISYRLGALGFLLFKDPGLAIPGNAGLKDQVMAMKWVKANIQFFGGDPENITLFGQDAGGVSTHLHCVSPMSVGLFHKAIMLSGNIYSEWATNGVRNPTLELAKELDWNGTNGERGMFDVILNSSTKQLLQAQANLIQNDDRRQFIIAAFVPSIEPYVSSQCFLSKCPMQMARNCWSKNIPIIQGYVSHEGYAFHNLLSMRDEMEYFAPWRELGLNANSRKAQEASLLVQGFYFGFSDPKENANLPAKAAMLSDKYFVHAFHRLVALRGNDPTFGPTYLLRFSFKPTDILRKFIQIDPRDKPIAGPVHGDDVKYIFKATYLPRIPQEMSAERLVTDRMCSILVSFARNGDPNNPMIATEHWDPLQQPAIDAKTGDALYSVYNLSNVVQQIPFPEAEQMHFWDYLFAKHGCKTF